MRLPGLLAAAFAACLLALPALPARGAPQILGLVASGEARPLLCRGAQCSLFLSSFCIQEAREPPAAGTRYRAAPARQALTLVVTTAAGQRLRVPAGRHLSFTAAGGYSAVRASLPRAALERLGGVAAALEVGRGASLIPVPVPGDPEPLDDEEIALATGPWRDAAAAVFESSAAGPVAEGARALAALINALPERGRADTETRARLWTRVAESGALRDLGPVGLERARSAAGVCRGFTRGRTQEPLRRCLERRHAAWLMDLNQTYWDRLIAW